MYIVFLRFSVNKAKAKQYMQGHNAWIEKGMKEGFFQLVGSLNKNQGGCIIANNIEAQALKALIEEDPFVIENVVVAETHEVTPSLTSLGFQFLSTD